MCLSGAPPIGPKKLGVFCPRLAPAASVRKFQRHHRYHSRSCCRVFGTSSVHLREPARKKHQLRGVSKSGHHTETNAGEGENFNGTRSKTLHRNKTDSAGPALIFWLPYQDEAPRTGTPLRGRTRWCTRCCLRHPASARRTNGRFLPSRRPARDR